MKTIGSSDKDINEKLQKKFANFQTAMSRLAQIIQEVDNQLDDSASTKIPYSYQSVLGENFEIAVKNLLVISNLMTNKDYNPGKPKKGDNNFFKKILQTIDKNVEEAPHLKEFYPDFNNLITGLREIDNMLANVNGKSLDQRKSDIRYSKKFDQAAVVTALGITGTILAVVGLSSGAFPLAIAGAMILGIATPIAVKLTSMAHERNPLKKQERSILGKLKQGQNALAKLAKVELAPPATILTNNKSIKASDKKEANDNKTFNKSNALVAFHPEHNNTSRDDTTPRKGAKMKN